MIDLGLKNLDRLVDDYVIASTTDLKGIIVDVSNRFCKMSGYSKEELIGHNHNIVRHPDIPSSIFKDMWDTIQAGDTWHGEVKNLTKDGGYYWVDSVVSPILDDKGKIIGYKSLRFDITGYKELELKTKEAEALANTIKTFLLDKNFDREQFIELLKNRENHPLDKINYIEPELWN